MAANILATAIGTICARHPGLFSLVLPRSLPGAFKSEIAAALAAAGGYPVPVGPAEGEYSAEQAISFRTPEPGQPASAILLLATDGQVKELKSLETFRTVLVNGLPGGLFDGAIAILRARDCAAEVARLVLEATPTDLSRERLEEGLLDTFRFLAAAYREVGNDERSWSEAYWAHLQMLAARLPAAAMALPPDGTSRHERNLVCAAAGLPRPSGASGYKPGSSSAAYARIVLEAWDTQDEVERSILAIHEIDTPDEVSHPLNALGWDDFVTSRTSYGHPVTALCYHEAAEDDLFPWLHAWAGTSETAFFGASLGEVPTYALSVRQAGELVELPPLDWKGLDHVLPLALPVIDAARTLSLGTFSLRLDARMPAIEDGCPVQIVATPASAATVEILSYEQKDAGFFVDFALSRKLSAKGGRWREKPFSLSVTPRAMRAGFSFRRTLALKIVAPHPACPTVILATETRPGTAPIPSFADDTTYDVTPDAITAPSPLPLRLSRLPEGTTSCSVHAWGLGAPLAWADGAPLVETTDRALIGPGQASFTVAKLPVEAVLGLGGQELSISIPTAETGEVNPALAAAMGLPVVAANEELERELRADPRFVLEAWFRDTCILQKAGEQVRASLATVVLDAAERGGPAIDWNAGIGTHANLAGPANLEFPAKEAADAGASAFWAAFDGLDLARFCGEVESSGLPGLLDLRRLERGRVEAYLAAFAAMIGEIGTPRWHAWIAYPFSALLFDRSRGEARGVLLSPLHPLRLAWAWSVQTAAAELLASPVFAEVATSFLRFVDGELLPVTGPATHGQQPWITTGLAAGPAEAFAGWAFLSNIPREAGVSGNGLNLLGLELPLGAPSGLDKGGVTSAMRDYMRIFPAAPQLRIGLAAPRGGQRFPETDESIIAAAGEVLGQYQDQLPGGIRIVDSPRRQGRVPSPARVLTAIFPDGNDPGRTRALPPFEWTTGARHGPQASVDIQFVEDTVVTVRSGAVPKGGHTSGTSGPLLPISRYRGWRMDIAESNVSSFALGVEHGSYAGLAGFEEALVGFEALRAPETGAQLEAEMMMGTALVGDHARWTITGNRYLDPSILAKQLKDSRTEMSLWEWRPAFLSRQNRRTTSASIASTHPYTVIARPSRALREQIAALLASSGLPSAAEDVRAIIAELGMRGVGLSSLLTMGHAHSAGALGFTLAFRGLAVWESEGGENEVRCIVPMDAIYPLVELLGHGAKHPDDQRRADLVLLSARVEPGEGCSLSLHPVEVKMRSGIGAQFPGAGSGLLDEPVQQLEATVHVLNRLRENLEMATRAADGTTAINTPLVLVHAALATLVEAAFSLRPVEVRRNVAVESTVIAAVAAGGVKIGVEPGTVLWFQVDALAASGARYEVREGDASAGEPGIVLASPLAFAGITAMKQLGQAIVKSIAGGSTLALVGVAAAVDPPAAPPSPTASGGPALRDAASLLASFAAGPAPATPVSPTPVANPQVPEVDPAASTEGIEVLVGEIVTGAKTRPVGFKPSRTSLNQLNIGVVGDLGTGKTQFLKSLVYQLASAGHENRGQAPKAFIFDYKQDYSSGDFPEAIGAKVLNPVIAPLPINFFALPFDSPATRVARANSFCDLLRRISNIGQVQKNKLYGCVMACYEARSGKGYPTIDDVFAAYEALGANDSVLSVLTLLKDMAVFEPRHDHTCTFAELFDRSCVLNLSDVGQAGQDVVDIIATMFLDNLYSDYMKKVQKQPFFEGSDGVSRRLVDSYVLIDEAHHAMGRGFEVLMKLMLEGREFGMGVILSSQYLSHFELGGRDWAEALSTWVVHNVRNATPKHFERIGFRANAAEIASEITKLKPHWAYYRCADGFTDGVLMKGQPFFSLPR